MPITDSIKMLERASGPDGSTGRIGEVVAISLVRQDFSVDTSSTFLRLVSFAPGRFWHWVVRSAAWFRRMVPRLRSPAGGSDRMPVDAIAFRELIQAVLRGDPDATAIFCSEYQSHIIRVVRRPL